MSTIAPTQPALPLPLPLPPPEEIYRIRVERYDRMVASGSLGEDDPIELLNGVLVTKMPKNPRHMWSVEAARDGISGLLPAGWSLRQEGPVRIPTLTSQSRTLPSSGVRATTPRIGIPARRRLSSSSRSQKAA